MAKITRLLLWGGGVYLLFAGCGNDYFFEGLEEPKPPAGIDILFVVDDSPSMADEQLGLAAAVDEFIWVLEEDFGRTDFRLAVTTTSVESESCPAGEGGKLLDRLGQVSVFDQSLFEFSRDPACRVVTRDNLDCLYHAGTHRGTLLVGNQGCDFRRGLSAMRRALESQPGFLRPEATLAVILVSDGEDCGEPGQVDESLPGVDALTCYRAAASSELTPVQEYHDFLMGLKGGQAGMVKFAALTGIRDSSDPLSTSIEFVDGQLQSACVTPGCRGEHCRAGPGTRAIGLADLFGLGKDGLASTICRRGFSESMWELGEFSACPTVFMLSEPLWNPGQADILINEQLIPRHSCNRSGELVGCRHPGDPACGEDQCQATWIYQEPGDGENSQAPGGVITFADHYNPCRYFSAPIRMRIFDPVP